MAKTILGVFTDRHHAERAVADLRDAGFDAKDISLVMRHGEEATEVRNATGTNVAEGAVEGATTGGVIGGLAGLLIGVGAIAIPGIGALLIGGPLAAALGLTGAAATTLSGAVTGAVAGGLLGALVNLGVPEEDARIYEDRIRTGGVLIAVPARSAEGTEVTEILEAHGAENIRSIENRDDQVSRRTHTESAGYAYPSEVHRSRTNVADDVDETL